MQYLAKLIPNFFTHKDFLPKADQLAGTLFTPLHFVFSVVFLLLVILLALRVSHMKEKSIRFTEAATTELSVLREAVMEILGMACKAFADGDVEAAAQVEPLEQIIDALREELRRRHIARLQQGVCTIEAGFVWADLLTDLSRISDHCSNVAGGVIDLHEQNLNTHEALRAAKSDSETFRRLYSGYTTKYLDRLLPAQG